MMNALRNLAARLKRPMFIAGLAVFAIFLAGEVRLLRPVWRQHGGGIWGDAFTYVSFARQMARGHFYFDHPIAPLVATNNSGAVVVNGPIWNTSVRADGKIVYSVAIGYPGFLAAACKAGGTWLMLHANLLLLTIALALTAFLIWEAMGRSFDAAVIACATALILPHLDPTTFNQFTYPWREPLSYTLILSAAWCVLRFRLQSKPWMLPLAGLLLGLACTVKEANFIYGIWLGLFGIFAPGAVKQRSFWIAVAASAAAFIVGLSPLLIQNTFSSGNPLVSLQSIRETSGFSMTQTGDGLRIANLSDQIQNYVLMYREIPLFRWTPLLAILGVVTAFRTIAIRFWLGALAVHLALYLQWGADFRHMFFALIPYTFFLSTGAWWIVRAVVIRFSGSRTQEATVAAGIVMTLAIAAAPRPWGAVLQSRDTVLKFRDLNAIVKGIESRMPENSLVLVNRPFRDHWAVYGDLPAARLHDLQEIGSLTNVYDVLEALSLGGRRLFFIDTTDREPRNSGRIDWSVVDREWLLWRYDLNSIYSLSTNDTTKLKHLTDRSSLTLYSIDPWSNSMSVVDCAVPTGGIAFVRVHPRQAGDDMDVAVKGRPLGSVIDGYVPWEGPQITGGTARITVSRKSGMSVPASPSVRLIGPDETISQETNPFSDPPDSFCFPDRLSDQPPDARYRTLEAPFRLRVPTRITPERFTVVSLNFGRIDESEWPFGVLRDGDTAPFTNLTYAAPWIPLASNQAALSGFRITKLPAKGLRLYGFSAYSARRRIAVTPSNGAVLIGISGYMSPDRPGEGSNMWSAAVDGSHLGSGTCGVNPFKNPRAVYVCASRGRDTPYTVDFHGAGLVEPVIGQTGLRLVLRMDAPTRAFCESGFFHTERNETSSFAWTMDTATVRVPTSPSTERYRLTISALDGSPTEDRIVTVTFAGQSRTIRLDDQLRDHSIELQAPTDGKGMEALTMQIKTWNPLQVLKLPDPRELGFQFYGLVWEPLAETPSPNP